jgi:hypothetical protein
MTDAFISYVGGIQISGQRPANFNEIFCDSLHTSDGTLKLALQIIHNSSFSHPSM